MKRHLMPYFLILKFRKAVRCSYKCTCVKKYKNLFKIHKSNRYRVVGGTDLETQELLVRRAIRGDEDAFLQLIKMYKVDLYKTSFSYFRNEEEALEALQEVTYRAFKSIRRVKEPAYFKTWLIRIMINYCNDQLRKKKREVLNEEYLASQGISETHEGLEIEEALLGLDRRSREIITLKYFHGLKIKEIAFAMECPEGTVKTWLHKALESLRTNLSEKGGM